MGLSDHGSFTHQKWLYYFNRKLISHELIQGEITLFSQRETRTSKGMCEEYCKNRINAPFHDKLFGRPNLKKDQTGCFDLPIEPGEIPFIVQVC